MVNELENSNRHNYLKKLLIGYIVVFMATYVITLFQENGGDFGAHILWAQKFNFANFGEYWIKVTPYPLWHICVNLFNVVLGFEWWTAAALVTAMVNGSSFLAAVWVRKCLFTKMDDTEGKTIFWIVCLMFVGPLYMPIFNQNYYLGQGTGNIWHNPSNIMVKVFAIIAFGMIVRILRNKKEVIKREVIELSIILVLSVLAKPSFIQAMIPGLGLYMIIRLSIYKSKREYEKFIKIVIAFVPAVIIMLVQLYITIFGNSRGTPMEHELVAGGMLVTIGEAFATAGEVVVSNSYQQGVGFAWGRVLSRWTPNVGVSFLLAFAFPMFVLLFNFKAMIKDKAIQLVWCYELVAWLEAVILYQKGPGEGHGNFLWASYLSMFLVWMVMLYYFLISLRKINNWNKKDKIYVYGGTILFAMHFIFGVMYAVDLIYPFF